MTIMREGQISEEFGKSLKVAFPQPANMNASEAKAPGVEDFAWYDMSCPKCGLKWTKGIIKGRPVPKDSCPSCKAEGVIAKEESAEGGSLPS